MPAGRSGGRRCGDGACGTCGSRIGCASPRPPCETGDVYCGTRRTEANQAAVGAEKKISDADSRVDVWVIAVDEALARAARAVVPALSTRNRIPV
ncbi:MAG: hypothetical protein HY308_11320 [Gammaproteobacteria bacterium]|nr:hypothetical protein [Gammaproteobacteria bacterium]